MQLDDIFARHERAVLQFSGGKDSLALLYLCRPWLDKTTVLFADSGAQFPHVTEYVERTCAKLGAILHTVRPEIDIREYHDRYGLPSDLVPVWDGPEWGWTNAEKPKQLLQSTATCCLQMLAIPMLRDTMKLGATLVLRGARNDEERRGVPSGTVDRGIEYQNPLWDWTEKDVWEYLERVGAEIPDHYAEVNSSLDCWLCTGHTTESHAAAQFRYVKRHHPELWPELEYRITKVRNAVDTIHGKVNAAFDMVEP